MRKQFTFYRSYFEAVVDLPKREQLSLLLAICEYALDGKEPSLTGAARGMFRLIQPTLDSSAAKAEIGKQGGSKRQANGKQTASEAEANAKQTRSKTQANAKQTASENEKENENENEKEIENECYISPLPPLDENFGEAGAALSEWLRYKAERGEPYKPQGLTAFLDTVRRNIKAHGADAVAAVIRDSMASGYHGVTWDRVRGMPQNAESRQHAFDDLVSEFMAEGDAS